MQQHFKAQNLIFSCPICLEEIMNEDTYSQLDSCNHKLCQFCFIKLICYTNNCPLCGSKFSGCHYIKELEIIHKHLLTESEMENLTRHKHSIDDEENFECFTKEEIGRELKHYQKIAEKIKINLFVQRNSDGSQKEWAILNEVQDRINVCIHEISSSVFDSKNVMKILDLVIQGIIDLQQRKHKDAIFYEIEEYSLNPEIDNPENLSEEKYVGMMYSIEYVDRKKSGPRKKKR